MPFSRFLTGAAQRYSLINGYVVADFGGLADHHSHAVIDEEATADLRPGMDLDARDPARDL